MFRISIIPALIICTLLAACGQQPSSGVDPVMERYGEIRDEMRGIVKTEGPKAALARFAEMIDDPMVSSVCHGLAHEIGQAAYMEYGFEESLDFEDDICGSGYLHGVIETHFLSVGDPATAVKTLCKPDQGKCFHGLGHGLMYSLENDVPQSLDLCKTLGERSERIACSEGVFMENFNTDLNAHPSKYLRADDPFFPCRAPEEPYKGVCAFYAPRFYVKAHPGAYLDALRWCTTVGDGPDDGCAKGVGSVAIKQNIERPRFVETVCESGTGDQQGYCIEGMVSYYIVHYASTEKGKELCGILKPEHQMACTRIANESERFYGE